jgi:hypothetical protein
MMEWDAEEARAAASLEQAAKNAETVESAAAPAAEVEKAAVALTDAQEGLSTGEAVAGAIETAEGITLSSVVAAAAPLILMYAFSEILDYFIQKAEKEAEEAEAYKAAHDEMNNFYEAHVPLSTDFFTASELARIKTLNFRIDGQDKPPPDEYLHFGAGTDRAYVRFDFLTKLIVMNYMSLSMVEETWLKSQEGMGTQALVIHIRQTEWLSTCESIRVLRLVDHHIRAPMCTR